MYDDELTCMIKQQHHERLWREIGELEQMRTEFMQKIARIKLSVRSAQFGGEATHAMIDVLDRLEAFEKALELRYQKKNVWTAV